MAMKNKAPPRGSAAVGARSTKTRDPASSQGETSTEAEARGRGKDMQPSTSTNPSAQGDRKRTRSSSFRDDSPSSSPARKHVTRRLDAGPYTISKEMLSPAMIECVKTHLLSNEHFMSQLSTRFGECPHKVRTQQLEKSVEMNEIGVKIVDKRSHQNHHALTRFRNRQEAISSEVDQVKAGAKAMRTDIESMSTRLLFVASDSEASNLELAQRFFQITTEIDAHFEEYSRRLEEILTRIATIREKNDQVDKVAEACSALQMEVRTLDVDSISRYLITTDKLDIVDKKLAPENMVNRTQLDAAIAKAVRNSSNTFEASVNCFAAQFSQIADSTATMDLTPREENLKQKQSIASIHVQQEAVKTHFASVQTDHETLEKRLIAAEAVARETGIQLSGLQPNVLDLGIKQRTVTIAIDREIPAIHGRLAKLESRNKNIFGLQPPPMDSEVCAKISNKLFDLDVGFSKQANQIDKQTKAIETLQEQNEARDERLAQAEHDQEQQRQTILTLGAEVLILKESKKEESARREKEMDEVKKELWQLKVDSNFLKETVEDASTKEREARQSDIEKWNVRIDTLESAPTDPAHTVAASMVGRADTNILHERIDGINKRVRDARDASDSHETVCSNGLTALEEWKFGVDSRLQVVEEEMGRIASVVGKLKTHEDRQRKTVKENMHRTALKQEHLDSLSGRVDTVESDIRNQRRRLGDFMPLKPKVDQLITDMSDLKADSNTGSETALDTALIEFRSESTTMLGKTKSEMDQKFSDRMDRLQKDIDFLFKRYQMMAKSQQHFEARISRLESTPPRLPTPGTPIQALPSSLHSSHSTSEQRYPPHPAFGQTHPPQRGLIPQCSQVAPGQVLPSNINPGWLAVRQPHPAQRGRVLQSVHATPNQMLPPNFNPAWPQRRQSDPSHSVPVPQPGQMALSFPSYPTMQGPAPGAPTEPN